MLAVPILAGAVAAWKGLRRGRFVRAGTGQVYGFSRRVGFMIEQLFARVSCNEGHLRVRDGREARLAEIVGGGA